MVFKAKSLEDMFLHDFHPDNTGNFIILEGEYLLLSTLLPRKDEFVGKGIIRNYNENEKHEESLPKMLEDHNDYYYKLSKKITPKTEHGSYPLNYTRNCLDSMSKKNIITYTLKNPVISYIYSLPNPYVITGNGKDAHGRLALHLLKN